MADTPISALDPTQRKLFESARAAIEAGNDALALDASTQVLRAAPGFVDARRLQRLAQLRLFRSRNRLIARAIGGLSSTPFIFSSASRDPMKALESAERILASDPKSTSALSLMAEAAVELDLPETAAFAREAIREIDPENTENLLALGKVFLSAGRSSEALRVANELLRIRPGDAAAMALLREALQPSGDSSAGEKNADSLGEDPELKTRQRLAELHLQSADDPNRVSIHREIALCYRELGRLDEAVDWVRRVRERPAGGADVSLQELEAELTAALLESQVRLAESALFGSPGDAEVKARVEAARRELASFRLYEARRYAELHPNDMPARLALGTASLDHGQPDAAIAHFEKAAQHAPSRREALVGLGRAHRALNRHEPALAHFLLAKAEPGAMDDFKKQVIYQLAECYEALGRGEEAIAQFKEIYAEDIEFRDVASRINAFYK